MKHIITKTLENGQVIEIHLLKTSASRRVSSSGGLHLCNLCLVVPGIGAVMNLPVYAKSKKTEGSVTTKLSGWVRMPGHTRTVRDLNGATKDATKDIDVPDFMPGKAVKALFDDALALALTLKDSEFGDAAPENVQAARRNGILYTAYEADLTDESAQAWEQRIAQAQEPQTNTAPSKGNAASEI